MIVLVANKKIQLQKSYLLKTSTSWYLLFPWKRTSLICRENACPGQAPPIFSPSECRFLSSVDPEFCFFFPDFQIAQSLPPCSIFWRSSGENSVNHPLCNLSIFRLKKTLLEKVENFRNENKKCRYQEKEKVVIFKRNEVKLIRNSREKVDMFQKNEIKIQF